MTPPNGEWCLKGLQYWCRLLSEVRHVVPGATWHVHVDDHDIAWIEELRSFDPSVE
jgi:hypothetical protein